MIDYKILHNEYKPFKINKFKRMLIYLWDEYLLPLIILFVLIVGYLIGWFYNYTN